MGEEGEKPEWGRRDFRRKWPETKVDFPALPFSEGSKITVKQIAFLHFFCRKDPADIVARYPRAITLAQVHLGLFHYFMDKEAIDAKIAQEIRFNARDTLHEASMTLPPARLSPLDEAREREDETS